MKEWEDLLGFISDNFDSIYNYFCKETLLRIDLQPLIHIEGARAIEQKLRTILHNTLQKLCEKFEEHLQKLEQEEGGEKNENNNG